MMSLADYCETYCDYTARCRPDDAGMAFHLNDERRWLQDHFDELTPDQRAAVLAADQLVLETARAATDRGIAVDLWDALAYAGYPAEGPVHMLDPRYPFPGMDRAAA